MDENMKTLNLNNKNTMDYTGLLKHFGMYNESAFKHLEENLENLFKKDLVNFTVNKKLGNIPSIALPNEMARLTFLAYIEQNKDLLKLERVRVLYNYLKENNSCINYAFCGADCYNNRLNYQYESYMVSTLRNLYLLLAEEKSFIEQSIEEFQNMRFVRLSVSGDVNERIWNVYKKIIKESPETTFYMYTKNYKFFNEIKRFPKNFVLNVSLWGNNHQQILKLYPNLKRHNFYHAYNSTEEIENIEKIEGKKYTEGICSKAQNNGEEVKCLKCKKCMTKGIYITTKVR